MPENDVGFNTSQDVLTFLSMRVSRFGMNRFESPTFNERTNTNYYLNEMRVEPEELRSISMSSVAMIKVIRGPFLGNMGASGGAIAVYLKKGAQDPLGLPSFYTYGYSPVKEFYSPDYSTNPNIPEPDYRSTLYWDPFVITDKNHRQVSITFYNNDITKKMKVVLEGCNENGQLTKVERTF